jgi:ribokinase
VLVPNEHEAAALVGRDAAAPELAQELAQALAVETVIVTAGAAGAFLAEADRVVHVPARACDARDTTGAGDAFVGALAARLWAGDTVADATEFAVRAATLSVTRPGTMRAFATVEECSKAAARPDAMS